MGAGSSFNHESFRQVADVYEANKQEEDIILLEKVMDTIKAQNKNEPVSTNEKGPESLKLRSQRFLYACGAYQKETSSAKANLTEATNLWFQGVDPKFTDEEKWTALHHAAGEGHTKIVEFLIFECGVEVDPEDEYNCTPLWVACCNDRRDVVKVLLLGGADTEIAGKPEGEPSQTPALAARRNRHPGLGDLVDAESTLRKQDDQRRKRQLKHEMDMHEFNDSMRESMKTSGRQGGVL